jgi:hypothetical protein
MHVLTRLSGFCVVAMQFAHNAILDDTRTTLGFFNNELSRYSQTNTIKCKLVFALQAMKDYHLPTESAFGRISQGTQTQAQGVYEMVLYK